MKKIYIIIVALLTTAAYAQDFRLGRVSKEELLEKAHPSDTSAPAAVLYKRGKTFFQLNEGSSGNGYSGGSSSFSLVHEIEFRIKIYKKEGYAYATDQISYYTGGRNVGAFYSDAYTYNLVGDKIEKTKLKSDGEFEEKKNENYSVKKITLPNVKEGSVIEYKYMIKTPYIGVFDDFYFQYQIPVNYVEYETAIPVYYTYRKYMKGYVDLVRVPEKKRMSGGGQFQEVVNSFKATKVKALKHEPYVNNLDNYIGSISHELASSYFPGGSSETYASDWESVADKIYKDDDFGKELNLKSYYEDNINAMIKQDMTAERKINTIFTYVKSTMNWNEHNRYYCEKGVKKAYADKVGNTAEINLMLISMLRHAGLDANPVLISTRANGIALFPSRNAFNYVIAAVEMNGGFILLDATSKNTLPNLLPIRALNWTGRLIRKDGRNIEIDLMPQKPSKEVVNITAEINAEGKVTGKARDQYFDYNAYVFRENYGDSEKNTSMQKIEGKYKGIQIDEYAVNNTQDLTKPVVEAYSFTHDNLVDVIGDKMYLNPMLFFAHTENPFKLDKREFPVDFGFPYQDRYMISLKMPDGYAVESLPQTTSLAMDQNIATFKYLIEAKGNMINVLVDHDMNYANIGPAYYGLLKDFYQKMVEKQSEKIVLKKI